MPPRSRPDHLQETLALYADPGLPCAEARSAFFAGVLPEDSPRRRLRDLGAEALTSAELFALLLGSETEKAREAAGAALVAVGGLFGLRRAALDDLTRLPGLGEAKASALLAAAELGARMGSARGPDRPTIRSPRDVESLLMPRLSPLDREHFVCVLLDTKNGVLASPTISVGTLTTSLVHPREVFKPAIRASAAGVVLAHNHPTGDPRPSPEDVAVTKRISEAGETIGIEVHDHVVFGDGRTYSLKEHGRM